MAYLDPHEEIWPKETGQWYDIDKNMYSSDTFAPFEGLCDFSVHTSHFAGTFFRFPLRDVRREKRVSTHTYDVNKLRALLLALREEAKCILLFLRSVRKVEVFEISQSGQLTNLLKVSICETSSDQLGSKRLRFQQNLKMLFEAQSFGIREKLSQVVRVQVDVHDYQESQYSSTSKWLVANQVGSQSEEIKKLANALKVFPWVGVALETSAAAVEHSGGRVFCVLPMPLEVSCKLPVHVNGTFSINDERRELKWRGIERKNDPSAQWNHLLVDELLPPCYASLLLDHAKMLLEPEHFCRAWPDTNKVRGTHWEGLLRPLLQALFAQQVIPFRKSGGFFTWVKIASAIFVPRGTQLPSEVYTALVACDVKLVNVPDAVWHALDYCSIHPKCVSALLTRAELRKCPGSYSGFSSNQKLKLLRYCLSDKEYGDLQNLVLLPLANGNFATFGTYYTTSVYLCSQQCPRYLLPNLDAELVDEDIEYQLYQKLKAIANGGYTNLQILTANTVATLLPRAMPLEWQHQTTVTLPHSNFDMQWLQRFWRWVSGENLCLFSDQQLVPISDSTVTRLNKSSPSLFIPRTQSYSPSLISCLKKLGVQCCEQKIHTFVCHNSELSSLMNFFSPEGIVDAIVCASPSYGSVSLTDDEAVQLRTHIDRVTVNPMRKFTLRNIPMFVTLNKNLCSVAEVERSTKRIAQIEPPSFSLSHKNLPSSVVLFSGSQSYQTRLLNSISVCCTNTVDLLINIVFPIVERGSGRNTAKLLMEEVLKKFDSITLNIGHCKRENFESAIAELSFLPVGVGKPKAPSALYTPSDPELRNLFYKEPVFPLDPFPTGKCLSVLKSCGLKTTVSPQEIVDIITSIGPTANTAPVEVNEVQHTRAKAVLTYIRNWESQLSETVCIAGYSRYHLQMFSEALKELSKTKGWLPVQSSPPANYPSCLTWKGSGYSSHLVSFGSSILLSHDQTSLAIACGSQMYFGDHSLSKSLCSVFTPEPEDMIKHVMAHLKEIILNHQKFHRLEDVRRTTHAIYQLLNEYAAQGYSVNPSLLVEDAEECVWITKQKRFVHPKAIALEQNPTFRQNLEPFIYILPSDLEEFESLFECLGVQHVVTKPQILGTLKKIRNGNPNNLGIGNNQAWHLVMAILNWLTDDGEQKIDEDDAESLLVPVEPDADWPVLLQVEDVVYTDNNFLRSFLESSDEECEYTFVNHRVTPHMASQLQVTPLSKHLNIADDAFEDVGQNEPLTIRLKNILKDYKDGLTIIKELLQNADDAEASEMNICYDARHHTEKCQSLFFPGMAECHGPALVVNNNAMFTEEDFQNITKLAGATKEGKILKIGKFGVGFCSVYHITDIPSFVSKDWLYIFDPTLSYLKDQIKNPARPGKRVRFTSNIISKSKQLAPYADLFDFDPQSSYEGTTFRLPFRTTASELSGKIYTENDVKQLMQQIQNVSSKLMIFLQHVRMLTFSRIDGNDEFPTETMRILMTTETIVGSRHIHQVTCTADGSPDMTDYWLVEKATETVLEKYSIASVACELSPLADKESYEVKPVEGEMFCFLPLSKKTGLPVHVSSNFAVSNNRTGIWTSDESLVRNDEVDWNESLMKGVIRSAYCELLEGLKEMQSDDKLEEYEFFSMWPVDGELSLRNPWQLTVEAIYSSIERRELFFSRSTEEWLAIGDSKYLDPNILNYGTSLPSTVFDVANHLRLRIVHLPSKYHKYLNLTDSTVTESAFLECFFANIDELETIKDSRNGVLCLALECYAHELDRQFEDRFRHLQTLLKGNACIPCQPDGKLLKNPNQLIHPHAEFAKLFDIDEMVFPSKDFYEKVLVEKAMKELGMLHDSIPLQRLEERATRVADLYEVEATKAMERAKLILDCLQKEDKCQGFSAESCSMIASIAFLPVLLKPENYPLPWKGDNSTLYAGKDVLIKGLFGDDSTNICLVSSQVAFLNQELPSNGGCGFVGHRVQEILQIRSNPAYEEVVQQFCLLIDEFDGSQLMMEWADRISRKVYEFIEKLLKPKYVTWYGQMEVHDSIDVSPLTERPCIWTGEAFINCSAVAKAWKHDGPYLFKVPVSLITRKHLQKKLGIKEKFTDEELVHTLQCLKRDYGTSPLPDRCQELVKDIISDIPLKGFQSELKPIILPDKNFQMHEATELYFDDMPWKPPETDYTFVHPIVQLEKAKALGVQLCRKASLARYSVAGRGFKVKHFGQHEELTRRIQNIIRDYPFDMTILKELLQNADDAKATKMHVILDMRKHTQDHIISEEWADLQGPALLVWNDSVFTEKDLEGIQSLGLGSKRSDSETIGQYGIGFNAVYHLTDCPSFVTGGNTLCVLDPHMRYVPEATDRYPGAMYENLDDKFWDTYDGMKSAYLRDSLSKELLGGSLFRFPLRHTPNLARSSEIVRDLHVPGKPDNKMITDLKMQELLKDWAPKMKQSLLFLNNVTELKFYEITGAHGVLSLCNSYKTELNEEAHQCRSELCEKIRAFAETRDPYITNYSLKIVDSIMHKGRETTEEWLIQQGIGDMQAKEKTWSYIEQVKPRHGIAAPCQRSLSNGQVFCFLPLPLHSRLPVHVNGHFILDSTRRNLWVPTERERGDDKSHWNENLLEAIVSSYAQFLERITVHFTQARCAARESLEKGVANYYSLFPRHRMKDADASERIQLDQPWKQLVQQVYKTMAERNSHVLAVPINVSSKASEEDKYLMHWKPLKNDLPEHQVHFWKGRGQDMAKLRLILERIHLKITCAPLFVMNNFSSAECEIPIVSPASIFEFYTSFYEKFLPCDIPCHLEDTPLKSVGDFKHLTKFLLDKKPSDDVPVDGRFPKEPFGFPLLVTDDNLLHMFDRENKVLCSKYAGLFPACPGRFLHKDLLDLRYLPSYFIYAMDDVEIRVKVVKELLETALPKHLKKCIVSSATDIIPHRELVSFWKCFRHDCIFASVLGDILKEWALLFTRDNRLFTNKSSDQLLPIIPLIQKTGKVVEAVHEVAGKACSAVEVLPGAPFLDIEVVPISSVVSICPKFSDPAMMLKNLWYLHQQQPFTASITPDIARALVRYFNKINFAYDSSSRQRVKHLPLFESIDGSFTEVHGKTVYVWPNRMCKDGIECWLKGTEVVFLNQHAAWYELTVDIVAKISPEKVYTTYVFPRFFTMTEKHRYNHLAHIRDELFNSNYANQSVRYYEISYPAHLFILSLKDLACIGEDGKPLKPICSFCTHKKAIFTTFPERFLFLPQSLLQGQDFYWMEFLLKLGLHDKVTSKEYLELCNDVARGRMGGETRKASKVLLEYLFSQSEVKLHGFHADAHFLANVSKVPFVCTVPLPELEWIEKAPHNVIFANKKEISVCALSGSCLTQSKELVWTILPIVSVSEYEPQALLQNLGINVQPSVQDVKRHLKNLSKSRFSNPGLLETYTAPQCEHNQTSLIDVMLSILKFLQEKRSEVDFSELKRIPCIPVQATGDYPVLVEPYRVVCTKAKETECFYPFIHSTPYQLLFSVRAVLNLLGVEDSIQLKHMQIVLESVFKSSQGTKLGPNACAIVRSAVLQLYSLLKSNQENLYEKMGDVTIAQQLNPLYLSGLDGKMHSVDTLVYSQLRDVDLHGTNLYLLWTPRSRGDRVYANDLCATLPATLRPKPLSKLCIWKVSECMENCEETKCATNITHVLQLTALSQGMCLVVQHIIGASPEKENIPSLFSEHLENFLETVQIRCVKNLMIRYILKDTGKTVAVISQKCFIERKDASFCLYLDSNVNPMDICDVRDCIAEELASSVKSKVNELEYSYVRKTLEYLLRANSSDDIYNFLREKQIEFNEEDCVMDMLTPKLGAPIPKSWHFQLDPNSYNIFRPQEWVGYEIREGEVIFAQVVHPIRPADISDEPVSPIFIKYKIFVREEDEEGREVKAIEIFKFTMGKEPSHPTIANNECREMVPYEGDVDDIPPESGIPPHLQQARDKIRVELRDIWKLPIDDRKSAIRRLYLKYHPDKNLNNQKEAEEAFKFLQEELDRLESGDKFPWRTYSQSWDRSARDQKYYSQQYYHRPQSSGGGWWSGGWGGGGGFSFPQANKYEGERWVKQAQVDLEALEALLTSARQNTNLSCHVCFMAHEVAEKALKGAMYATCGLGENSLKSHQIGQLAYAIEAEKPRVAIELAAKTTPLESYYLDTRFPNRCCSPTIPYEKFRLSQAESAADCARGILKIVRDIV